MIDLDLIKDLVADWEDQQRYNQPIPPEKWGIHQTHCCPIHGCKYDDEQCPVRLGLTKGIYCEDCYEEANEYESFRIVLADGTAETVYSYRDMFDILEHEFSKVDTIEGITKHNLFRRRDGA